MIGFVLAVLMIFFLTCSLLSIPLWLAHFRRDEEIWRLIYVCKLCKHCISLDVHPKHHFHYNKNIICQGCGELLRKGGGGVIVNVTECVARWCNVTKRWIPREIDTRESEAYREN